MKLLIIKKVIEYFTSYFKLKKIEISIVGNLTKLFRDYQDNKDPDLLDKLRDIIDFMKLNGINGRTTKTVLEIEKYWADHINDKNVDNHKKSV